MQICQAPAAHTVRQLSAEEFCLLARREACGLYRPHSEVARILIAGEAWGLCSERGDALAAQALLPLNSNTAAAAAMREYLHWNAIQTGCVILPPVSAPAFAQLPALIEASAKRALRLARGGQVWAALECGPQAEAITALYLQQGFALRAVRPLCGLAPCLLFVLGAAVRGTKPVWVPLADLSRVAAALARGWAAAESRPSPLGLLLGMRPPESIAPKESGKPSGLFNLIGKQNL